MFLEKKIKNSKTSGIILTLNQKGTVSIVEKFRNLNNSGIFELGHVISIHNITRHLLVTSPIKKTISNTRTQSPFLPFLAPFFFFIEKGSVHTFRNFRTIVVYKHNHLCSFSHPSPSHDHLLQLSKGINNHVSACWSIKNSNKTVTHKHNHLCPFSHPSSSHDHLKEIN
jgi:hypothetical protein